ncbi:xanthine dehydrogenase accessory factor [Thermosyntropha lipolytica DSM 11003]|uniref:Xanthine dehydrogenase accessory factor n=1 Tax=Thermosyntropha lipolytica DSM 11003 TaxID=1123382 RepID=A0A1M5LEI4_9FIRM|nr:XdhC/CoxI family protein [Thermosyntropha lipolytica]SHG62783.1 xanthine dehydrogenase accessory factor [Thermosyntropha lipolytica DSM 11003]
MENIILDRVVKEINQGRRVALAMVTRIWGSSPSPEGAMMAVWEDGNTLGTVGGGSLEGEVIAKAQECLAKGQNEVFTFELNNKEAETSLNMICGGKVEVFIRVFIPRPKLLIVGGGHVAYEIYKLGKFLDFYTVIFEDRPEFGNFERFPQADDIKLGDIKTMLSEYPIDENCYIVIVTRGHAGDEEALQTVINSNAAYIGMIGSKRKVSLIREKLRNQGIGDEKLNKIYAPIGLDLGGDRPAEIAFSIMAEILLVKNKGQLRHLKLGGE